MATENTERGLFRRVFDLAVFLVVGMLVYIASITILMLLRGPIIAASGEGSFNIIFGAWVLATLGLISLLR